MRRRLGLDHRLPRRSAAGHRRADRRFRHRPAPRARHRQRALPAQPHRPRPEACSAPCRTACSISARVKLRDQQRLKHGPLTEYSQYGQGIPFGEAVPRAGNDSGGGQPGWILKCKGWETDPNAYIYFITQAPVWEAICDVIGKPEWKTDPDYATPPARLPRLKQIFDTIEQWTMTKTKFEAMDICNEYDIPCRPDPVDEGDRRGASRCARPAPWSRSTIRRAASISRSATRSSSRTAITEVKRSPLLGEHTDEILTQVLGYSAARSPRSRRRARSPRRTSRRPQRRRIRRWRKGAVQGANAERNW